MPRVSTLNALGSAEDDVVLREAPTEEEEEEGDEEERRPLGNLSRLPELLSPPSIVKVFPEPVCPYARTEQL